MAEKLKSNVICIVVCILSHAGQNRCASINDTNVLLRDILEEYNKNIRPVENQSNPVDVNVTLLLVSIQELDEIRGTFSIMGNLLMKWHDANMIWNPIVYGGIDNLMTSYKEVWVPEMILVNPAEESDTLGKKWQRVHFRHNGFASWWPGDLIKSTCVVDVYNYPFDTQGCLISFGALGYVAGQVKISSEIDTVDLRFYTESPTWKFAKSKAKAVYSDTQIQFHIHLQRKPGYVIVNIILPLTFLSLLNAFVFLLVPESGERISYCITVLLSIAVFMTIVSETLPKSSEPVPVISYKLMFDMALSSLMTLVTILNLRLYNRNDSENVPFWLQSMYLFLSCKRLKYETNPIADNDVCVQNERKQSKTENGNICLNQKDSKQRQTEPLTDIQYRRKLSVSILDLEEVVPEAEKNGEDNFHVPWRKVSNMIDGIAFIVFTLLAICSLSVFLVITLQY